MEFTEEQSRRFWAKVNKETDNGCWEWTAATRKGGYGIFRPTGKTFISAHRMSYIISNGEIHSGSLICHSCNNPSCVNPLHLYSGTQFNNMRQAFNEGRLRVNKLMNKNNINTEFNQDEA